MCHHNNQMGYCPSCVKEKGMGRRYSQMGHRHTNQMGIVPQGLGIVPSGMGLYPQLGIVPQGLGAYELIPGSGIWVPDASDLAAGAGAGALSTAAQQLAQSQGVQQAGIRAAEAGFGANVFKFFREKPVIAWGGLALIIVLTSYGAMNWARGK
jgi:hypothetical protein